MSVDRSGSHFSALSNSQSVAWSHDSRGDTMGYELVDSALHEYAHYKSLWRQLKGKTDIAKWWRRLLSHLSFEILFLTEFFPFTCMLLETKKK